MGAGLGLEAEEIVVGETNHLLPARVRAAAGTGDRRRTDTALQLREAEGEAHAILGHAAERPAYGKHVDGRPGADEAGDRHLVEMAGAEDARVPHVAGVEAGPHAP